MNGDHAGHEWNLVLAMKQTTPLPSALQPLTSVEEFEQLLRVLEEPLNTLVDGGEEPAQRTGTTLTQLEDLFALVVQHGEALAAVNYRDARLLANAITAVLTADAVLRRKKDQGVFKVPPRSRRRKEWQPWVDKLLIKAEQAFFYDAPRLQRYQSGTSSRTAQDEARRVVALFEAAVEDGDALAVVGFTAEDMERGRQLAEQARMHDSLGLVGIRNQKAAGQLRNRLLSLAVVLGKHARISGMSAFWNEEEKANAFKRISLRNAVRSVRERGKKKG